MNYLNIHTDTLKSVEFIGADPTERATWISLLGWCASQENGGVIEDCRDWPDRKWQQLCGVLKSEVESMSELYGFQGDNLVVTFYPIESESAVKAKRKAGKKGGRPKKESAETKQPREEKPHGYPNGKPQGSSELKRKEKEGKEKEGKERKRKESTVSASTDEKGVLLALWEHSPKWSRQRSSKKMVFEAWQKVKKSERPSEEDLVKAIQAWGKCEEWTRDGGQYAQGLHLWIKAQRWDSLPEAVEAQSGQRSMKTLTPDML